MAERFISVKQVLDRVCLSKTQLYKRINAGTFPRSVPLGTQKVVFLESEIDAWMLAQVAASDAGSESRRNRPRKAAAARRDRRASS
jgi:prophage regulatory protein